MSKLKIIIGVVLVIGLTSFCFANVPIKLDIQGTTMFTDTIIRPSGGYTAELTGATSTGEYEWDISVSTPYANFVGTPQGKHATIEFTSAPSTSEGELMVTILCKTYYMDGNQRKSESAHLNVTWKCPRLTYGINGNTEVLDGIEETYTAWVSIEGNPNPSVIYEWRKGESQGSGNNSETFTTIFDRADGQNVTLYCDIEAGDIPLKAQTEIHVNTYAMTAKRWDYSGTNAIRNVFGRWKRIIEHDRSTTDDNHQVYIHYNIDDDDENNKCDFDQEEFTKRGLDDDLCELKINIIVQGEFTVDDLDKPITITTPSGLRLWRSQYRSQNDFLQGGGNNDKSITKSWPVSSINGQTIYVEGIKYNSDETLTITFGKITKTLKYKTCSVGDETTQPDLETRKRINGWFENLVDCEWCVIRPENPTYNCIAFSVDPYLTTFKDVSYTNKYEIRNNMDIDPKYPYPFRVEDIGHERISPPTDADDENDRFRLLFSSNSKIKYQIARLVTYFKNKNPEFKGCVEKIKVGFGISGYTGCFKANAVSFYSRYYIVPNNNSHWTYYLTMNDFNSNGTNEFDWFNDVNAFFTSDVWKKNNKKLTWCSQNDINRIVTFYTGFHAARRASTLEGKEKVEEKDMPPGWYIFASKCGDWEAIIHREEQICGESSVYGQKYMSFKFEGK